MLTSSGLRVVVVDEDGYVLGYSERMGHTWIVDEEDTPDRDDFATRAILEVQKAQGPW